MQSQMMSYLALAQGTSIVFETVFESRNKHISELKRMGADITQSKDCMTSVIRGVDSLEGTIVEGRDLRGGAALILAGLAAKGETIVTNSNFVERGYVEIENMLKSIGANINFFI